MAQTGKTSDNIVTPASVCIDLRVKNQQLFKYF